MSNRFGRACVVAAVAACSILTRPLLAQQEVPAQNVELEPITCFWRTSTDAVRVGEIFALVLTCGVLDTAATTVVPDQSRLDPGALQLPPFEVRGGAQAPDLRTATRRVFQYEYQLRYVGEEIGRDLRLPPLTLTYRVQSRVQQGGAAVESRERQYILPAHTVRILSIVPMTARDIREASPVTLAQIDSRRFRASLLRIVSWALYGIAVVVGIAGMARTVRRRRTRTAVVVRHATDSAILSAVQKELGEVRRARGRDGWTGELAARALAALRICASYATAAHVTQTPARKDTPALSGQLRVSGGWPPGSAVLVSGAATPEAIARLREREPDMAGGPRARLDELAATLASFSRAAYGRDTAPALDALDDALLAGERALAALRREHSFVATRLRALRHWTGESVRARRWARS